MLLNPKTLEDAKRIIETTVVGTNFGSQTWLEKIGLHGVQQAIDNWNGFFGVCGNVMNFIKNCLTEPHFLIDKIQLVSADVLLILLAVLIIMRFLGFKDITKWISLSIFVAIIIAVL